MKPLSPALEAVAGGLGRQPAPPGADLLMPPPFALKRDNPPLADGPPAGWRGVLPPPEVVGAGRNSAAYWRRAVEELDFALQPIVNIHTGVCEGCEALLRQQDRLGYTSPMALFNAAHADGRLPEVELALRDKAINKFTTIPFHHRLKLFYNLDNRLLSDAGSGVHISLYDFVLRYGIMPGTFVYEISERHEENMQILHDGIGLKAIKAQLSNFRGEMFKFAIDDFGTGLSGLQMLYHSEPDFLKIDRFFIDDLAGNRRKKLFVASTINMARTLGNTIIAEGVEREDDFHACHLVGCDYVQGYLIQRPTLNSGEILETYPVVAELQAGNRRSRKHDREPIMRHLEQIHPIPLYRKKGRLTKMEKVLETFSRYQGHTMFPVINPNQEPVGVIREKDIKEYVYSPYGKDILRNREVRDEGQITRFITRLTTADIHTPVEKILEIFSMNPESEGTVLTENGKYLGFLSANALLKLLFEKNLEEARDSNPLTRLPGNFQISRFIAEGISDGENGCIFCYFDFDNFKPFNDLYGLRNGDRAIIMFADLLKETANRNRCFVGHVGGDDFFIGFGLSAEQPEVDPYRELIGELTRRFASDVVSIYSREDQQNGYISGQDREGNPRRFPLLTVSAAMLTLPPGVRCYSQEEIFSTLADLKKQAKRSPEKLALLQL